MKPLYDTYEGPYRLAVETVDQVLMVTISQKDGATISLPLSLVLVMVGNLLVDYGLDRQAVEHGLSG